METEEIGQLPDGSGFAILSMLLPENHWLFAEGDNEPPMPLQMGTDNPDREDLARDIRAAARYAMRCATENGKIIDFDPDALVGNMVVGLLGYWTPDGLSHEENSFSAPPPAMPAPTP